MPNPNEVMKILSNHASRVAWDGKHGSYEEEYQTAKRTLDHFVAQQNAALLRELLGGQKTILEYLTPDHCKGVQAIPASILEAKLNEITKEVA